MRTYSPKSISPLMLTSRYTPTTTENGEFVHFLNRGGPQKHLLHPQFCLIVDDIHTCYRKSLKDYNGILISMKKPYTFFVGIFFPKISVFNITWLRNLLCPELLIFCCHILTSLRTMFYLHTLNFLDKYIDK